MKTRTNALLLAFFLGGVGAHKFYLNRTGQGLAYLLFFWTLIPGLIAIADIVHLAFMSDSEFHRRFNSHVLAPVGGYAPYQQQPHALHPHVHGHPQPYPQFPQGYPSHHGHPPHGAPPPQSAWQHAAPPQPPPPAAPAPAPGSEYHARLSYLEHLRQTGAMDEAAYEAAKEELRRAN